MIVFGVDESIAALESGALETIMIYEELELQRFEIKNQYKNETKIYYLNKVQ